MNGLKSVVCVGNWMGCKTLCEGEWVGFKVLCEVDKVVCKL